MQSCLTENCPRPVFHRVRCMECFVDLKCSGYLSGTKKRDIPAFVAAVITMPRRDDCILWPFSFLSTGMGYGIHSPSKTTAHRHVLKQFSNKSPEPSIVAAHSQHCISTLCVNPYHLRWATIQENLDERIECGTLARGERQGLSVLTESQVIEIKTSKEKTSVLSRRMSVSHGTVWAVRKGVSWGWLTV